VPVVGRTDAAPFIARQLYGHEASRSRIGPPCVRFCDRLMWQSGPLAERVLCQYGRPARAKHNVRIGRDTQGLAEKGLRYSAGIRYRICCGILSYVFMYVAGALPRCEKGGPARPWRKRRSSASTLARPFRWSR
jgi:hypothetical protein